MFAFVVWLALLAGKMIGYPSGQDGAILPSRNYHAESREKNFPESQPYNNSFIDRACSVKMA